jgi:hypothetical protein
MLWRGRTESWIVWLRADGPEGARVRAQMMRLGLYQRLASYDTLPTPLASHADGEKIKTGRARWGKAIEYLRGTGSIQLSCSTV